SPRRAHHLLAFIPERLRVIGIQRVSAHALADDADGHVVGNDAADVTVLAVASTDFVSRSDDGGPYGSGRPLRNGLPLIGWLAFGGELLVDLLDQGLCVASVQVAAQLCVDAARMDRCGADAACAMAPVEGHSEEDVRRL